jgi:ABC-type branched-subunit amino acid transport system substrate-binding protein
MAAPVRRLPHFAVGLVSLVVLLAGCSPRVTAPPEPPYAVRRGDEAFRYEDYGHAITSYRTYLDEAQKDQYTARVLYKTALAEYRLGHYHETLATIDELEQRYPKGRWVQVDALRGDAARELHRPMTALKDWDEGWEIGSDNDRRKLRQRIVSLARGFNDVQLAQAQRTVSNADVRDLLEQQIAARQPSINEQIPESNGGAAEEDAAAATTTTAANRAAEGKGPRAPLTAPEAAERARRPAVRSAARTVIAEPPAAEAEVEPLAPALEPEGEGGDHTAPAGAKLPPPMAEAVLWPPADAQVKAQPKVACLLPLSGPSQEFGERSLRGLRLLFGENSDRLVVMDTGNDSATAVHMFNQLSRNANVVAVIGPLRSEDAEAVAPLARQAQVPLLLLSQHDGLADGSVLQVSMTRARLVAAVLQYAMGSVRLRRFGILYPEDDFGKQYAATFRSEAEHRGGTIVGVDAYSPLTRALSVATLKRWRDNQHLQAVFLPDNVLSAQAVAHVLQREMPDITLLGVHGWESIGGQDGDHVNGVLFSDSFYSGSTRPGTQQFVERFQKAYSEMPGALEAQAYDAGLLAQDALEAGARSRVEVLHALRAHAPIDGATGQLTVTPTGVQRQVFLLQVYDGKLAEVSDGTS